MITAVALSSPDQQTVAEQGLHRCRWIRRGLEHLDEPFLAHLVGDPVGTDQKQVTGAQCDIEQIRFR
jgi:hypothetical protein